MPLQVCEILIVLLFAAINGFTLGELFGAKFQTLLANKNTPRHVVICWLIWALFYLVFTAIGATLLAHNMAISMCA